MTIKLGTIDLAGLASSNSDNISITHNSSNKLQTIGIINQKDTTQSFKTWVGTKAEYDALETKNNDTIYNVTDDGNVNQSLLEMIYPIGSIYIGTMNVCPLSALFGTWQLVAQDRVLQGAGTRGSVGSALNESLPNITGTFNFDSDGNNALSKSINLSGAFTKMTTGSIRTSGSIVQTNQPGGVDFNASRSSSTYQDNAPVQQDAYLVNIWRRTA